MDDIEWDYAELRYLLDRRSAAVLRVAHRRGGSAKMSEVASETGLSRGELYHLFSDLDRMDLVRNRHTVADHGIERQAVLSPGAERAIEEGILDDFEDVTVGDEARRIYRRTKWLEGVVHR